MLYRLLINKLSKTLISSEACVLNLSLYNNKENTIFYK